MTLLCLRVLKLHLYHRNYKKALHGSLLITFVIILYKDMPLSTSLYISHSSHEGTSLTVLPIVSLLKGLMFDIFNKGKNLFSNMD